MSPASALVVAKQPGLLDRRVESFGAVGQLSAQHPHPRQDQEREGNEGGLAGGSGHGDHPLSMVTGGPEPVQVQLGAGEVDGGVEPQGQIAVREPVHQCGRLGAVLLRLRDEPAQRRAPCQRGGCGGDQGWIAQGSGGLEGLLASSRDLGEPHPVDTVHGELQHERNGLG